MTGVKSPKECKFSVPVTSILVLGVVEMLDTTKAAQESILKVAEWKA